MEDELLSQRRKNAMTPPGRAFASGGVRLTPLRADVRVHQNFESISPMDSRTQTRQVAVLVETDDSWGCSVIRGIADYSQNHGHWNLLIDPQDHDQRSALPDLWSGDGVIVRFGNRLQVDQVRSRKVPTVNVDTLFEGLPGICDVITDDYERAQLAFNHLRDRGFEKFAYFAPPNQR